MTASIVMLTMFERTHTVVRLVKLRFRLLEQVRRQLFAGRALVKAGVLRLIEVRRSLLLVLRMVAVVFLVLYLF